MLELSRLTAIGDFWRNHLSRANYMHSDAASQGGGWWQGYGAAYILPSRVMHQTVRTVSEPRRCMHSDAASQSGGW